MTSKPLHQAVIAPSMMYLLYSSKAIYRAIRASSSKTTSSMNAKKTLNLALLPGPPMW
jgi:hypothetical protein